MPGAGGRDGPAWIDLFEASREMRFVTLERLPEVARTLAAAGWVVIAAYAEGGASLAFRGVPRRLRCFGGANGWRDDEFPGGVESGAGAGEGEGEGEGAGEEASGRVALAYEDEMSERRSSGAVSVGRGAWWTVALSVPVERGEPRAYVRLVRHVGGGVPGEEESADFAVPASEVDALLVLLGGVVRQARRHGVLALP